MMLEYNDRSITELKLLVREGMARVESCTAVYRSEGKRGVRTMAMEDAGIKGARAVKWWRHSPLEESR